MAVNFSRTPGLIGRRTFLQAGGISAMGLELPELLGSLFAPIATSGDKAIVSW